jgi:SAM-dependent methyltransferase
MLMDALHPRSVIDVGCGTGTFLAAFREAGVTDVWGVDGDYVDRGHLEIPAASFDAVDLNKPFHRDRTYDLALSLEVAEHLEPARSESFVEDLTRLAPVVCFSAAIPGQGGTSHIAERWQDEWAAMFRSHGFMPTDLVRDRIWNDTHVQPWYAQNLVVYTRDATIASAVTPPCRVVHPEVFTNRIWEVTRPRTGREMLSDVRGVLRARLGRGRTAR